MEDRVFANHVTLCVLMPTMIDPVELFLGLRYLRAKRRPASAALAPNNRPHSAVLPAGGMRMDEENSGELRAKRRHGRKTARDYLTQDKARPARNR